MVIGRTPRRDTPQYWGGDRPWASIADMHTEVITQTRERITHVAAQESGARLLEAGTLLMSFKLTIGKLAIAGIDLYTNEAIVGLVPKNPKVIDRDYLRYALTLVVPRAESAHAVKGRTLNQQSLGALLVPVPPLSEQRRIAAALKEQLAAVERARTAAAARLDAAQSLPGAYLRAGFGGITPLAVGARRDPPPAGWQWRRLTELARLESGHTPSRYHPEWWGGKIPWIALPDIRELNGQVAYETSEYTNDAGIANSSARVLPADTVVLSRTASVGFVTIMGREMATSQDFVNWVCGPELHPRFLFYLLMRSREYVRSLSSGAIHQTVYMPTVEAFEVCVPGRPQQERIVSSLAESLAAAAPLRERAEEEVGAIGAMPPALLRRAFGGQY